MPELPEVETILRVITPQLCGQTISHVELLGPHVAAYPTAAEFSARLTGQIFTSSCRRGKFMRFTLQSGDTLTLHLRMTGGLVVLPASEAPEPHTHLILHLSGGSALHFTDQRKFGRFWLLRADEKDTITGMHKLGPEPSDPAVTGAYLQSHLRASRRAVKEALMDQSLVAGIGNIYSDEILHAARIHPAAPCCTLTTANYDRIAALIPERMAYFVEKNAITPEDYLITRGREYRNTPYLQVYGRKGQPCLTCGAPIEKRTVGGRGNHYCPACQKAP